MNEDITKPLVGPVVLPGHRFFIEIYSDGTSVVRRRQDNMPTHLTTAATTDIAVSVRAIVDALATMAIRTPAPWNALEREAELEKVARNSTTKQQEAPAETTGATYKRRLIR